MILITGASGNVGREVLKQIIETGAAVRAAFQSMSKAASAPLGVEVAVVDYEQPETLRTALKGVEKVFLVGPPTAQLVALERSAIDTIRQSEVRQVVKLSAMGGRAATFPRQHAESEVGEPLDWKDQRPLVPVGDRDEDGAVGRQRPVGGGLTLGEGAAEVAIDSHHLAGGFHLRAEQ